MNARDRRKGYWAKAHSPSIKRAKPGHPESTGIRLAALRAPQELDRRRVEQLYEISMLLNRFDGIDETLRAVLRVVSSALALRSAILLVENVVENDRRGEPRSWTWHPEGHGAPPLKSASAHLEGAYGYLVRSGGSLRPEGVVEEAERRHPPVSQTPSGCMLLPLVVGREPIFGALHVAGAMPFNERDLAFVNAVVNQTAIALARQASIEARRTALERRSSLTHELWITAEQRCREAVAERAAAKASEELIGRELAFVREVTASLGEGVVVMDLAGRITFMSPPAERVLDCSAKDALGSPIQRVVQVLGADGEPVPAEGCPFQRAMQRPEVVACDDCLVATAKRPILPIAYTCAPLVQKGRVAGAVLTLRDLSATRRTDREQRMLAEAGAAFAASLEHQGTLDAVSRFVIPRLADVCFVDEVSEGGSVERVATRFADERKQRELSDALRRSILDLGLPPTQQKVLESGEAMLVDGVEQPSGAAPAGDVLAAAGIRSQLVVPLVARGKKVGVLSLALAESGRTYSEADLPIIAELGRRAAVALDNALLYERAQRATLARDDLLAIVAHDLKNPLGVILMSLSMLERTAGPERRLSAQRPLSLIHRSAKRMDRLIRDLLDSAGIDSGHLSLQVRRVDVRTLVSEALEGLSEAAEKGSMELTCEFDDDLPDVAADAGRLQQVLGNLVGNALKFTPPAGTISVHVRRSGDLVTFSVKDTGPGIDEADRVHLFDRFWQARRTAQFGSGLGLFIVKGIVEAHGGTAWVESAIGAGSTFFFSVPVATEDFAFDSTKEAPSDGASSRIDERSRRVQEIVREMALCKRELETALETTRVARELAERALSIKSDFMNVVSHELRSPLTALGLLIERLQRTEETAPSPAQLPLIRKMTRVVARLSAAIESLILHGLLQSKRISTHVETFDGVAMTRRVIDELRLGAEEKGLHLILVAPPDLPRMSTDPRLVRLILLNLIGNAIKFTAAGSVEVSVAAGDGQHQLAVRDSGPGIPAADQSRIFEPFAHVADARQKHTPGMGLGLALVREIVTALGGELSSSSTDRGSTFRVVLPAMAQDLHCVQVVVP